MTPNTRKSDLHRSFRLLRGETSIGTFSGEMQTKKAANKAMDRYVRKFLGCGGILITSEQSHAVDLYFQFTMQPFREMGGYTEDLKQSTKLAKLEWGGGCLFGDGRLRGDGTGM